MEAVRTLFPQRCAQAYTRRVGDTASLLVDRLLALKKVPSYAAVRISGCFIEVFGDRAEVTLKLFLKAGWTYQDIVTLISRHRNNAWKTDPQRLFSAVERLAAAAGIEPARARELVIERGALSAGDPECLQLGLQTLLNLGFTPTDVAQIIQLKVHVLFQSTEHLRHWHAQMRALKLTPLAYLSAAVSPPALKLLERRHATQPAPHSTVPLTIPTPVSPAQPVLVKRKYSPRQQPTYNTEPLECEATQEAVESVLWQAELDKIQHALSSHCSASEWNSLLMQRAWIRDGEDDVVAAWKLIRDLNSRAEKTGNAGLFLSILRNPDLHPILRLSSHAIRRRIYFLQRLGREFTDRPGLLLISFENLSEDELRFRLNALAAGEKKSGVTVDFATFVLQPREDFLAALAKHVRKHSKHV